MAEWIIDIIVHYNGFTTIKDVNDWILSVTRNGKIFNASTPSGQNSIRASKRTLPAEFGNKLRGAIVMEADSQNNDCLIHSFLTCISEAFRQITDEQRSMVAAFFRRYIMPVLPPIIPIHLEQKEQDADNNLLDDFTGLPAEDDLLQTGLLSEVVGRRLANRFHLNILFVVMEGPILHPKIDITHERKNTIVIENQGLHFSPVKIGETYLITMSIQEIMDVVETIEGEYRPMNQAEIERHLLKEANLAIRKQEVQAFIKQRLPTASNDVVKAIESNIQAVQVAEPNATLAQAFEHVYQEMKPVSVPAASVPAASEEIPLQKESLSPIIPSTFEPQRVKEVKATLQKKMEVVHQNVTPALPKPDLPKIIHWKSILNHRGKVYQVTHAGQTVNVRVSSSSGPYQIASTKNKYDAIVTPVQKGGTRHKKKRVRSTRRIKPSMNVKRR